VYRDTSNCSAVLLLPYQRLDEVGVPGTLNSLGLLKEIPKCYKYDSRTGEFTWEETYDYNGENVLERELPVIFFDDNGLSSRAAWVAAKSL
ncbi:hypothetical protein EDB80DRAFT_534989, partial [Ilyonectria destructans]